MFCFKTYHNMSKKQEKNYVCTEVGCNNTFNRPYRLEQHLLSHFNIKPFPCPWDNCSKAYSNKSHMKRHIASAHKKIKTNIINSCSQCLKTYSNRQNLKKHIKQKHMVTMLFVCDYCKAQYKKKHQLSAHMHIHNGVKAFRCDTCSKEFVTLYEKRKHMKCHKIYKCDQCSLNFNYWSKYQKHRKSEHMAKKYICNDCGKVYNQRCHIIRHLKIHSNTVYTRTFSCPYPSCFRRYSRNSNLTQHILIKHEKIKHMCNICNADYSTKAKLNEHLKVHKDGYQHTRKKPKTLATGRKKRKDTDTIKIHTALKLAGIVSLNDNTTNSNENVSQLDITQ